MKWVEVLVPTPVLNTPDFQSIFGGKSGLDIPRNQDGHPEAYEFVALPGMFFSLRAHLDFHILQVESSSYASTPIYIDARFCQIRENMSESPRPLPTASVLLNRMERRLGTPYVWGGNWAEGVLQLLEYYKPKGTLDPRIEELWLFRGLDCSGLLFEASMGSTPRNTSELILFGHSLKTDSLLPMDMIIYPGHVLFVRDQETIIESKSPFGVRIQPLQKRLDELLAEKAFVRNWETERFDPKKSFTIRRFCVERAQ